MGKLLLSARHYHSNYNSLLSRSGLNDYIMKPYREEDILEKITRHHQMA